MNRARRFFRTSFGSALLGGAVVAIVGLVALATGVVKAKDGGSTVTVAAPLAPPVNASENSDPTTSSTASAPAARAS